MEAKKREAIEELKRILKDHKKRYPQLIIEGVLNKALAQRRIKRLEYSIELLSEEGQLKTSVQNKLF